MFTDILIASLAVHVHVGCSAVTLCTPIKNCEYDYKTLNTELHLNACSRCNKQTICSNKNKNGSIGFKLVFWKCTSAEYSTLQIPALCTPQRLIKKIE